MPPFMLRLANAVPDNPNTAMQAKRAVLSVIKLFFFMMVTLWLICSSCEWLRMPVRFQLGFYGRKLDV
ncbi:hypothetical protein ALP90_01235 [Pseudomonas amygdali pv. ulmi]|uniref:Uncharacterized protein n=1 Tax=Pseudomonas amygdali pv. ulmi TaxID=251720 RepID=A0A3M4SJE1_PSEA0|nr:hypothetical protein ALP90_01235 [Pseudomonas amygdali pv. ulmi]